MENNKPQTSLELYLENLGGVFEWEFELEKAPEPQTWKLIDQMEFPENRWLVRNLFPKEGVSIIASVSGEGKSLLVMDLAKCISEGTPWLGNPSFETVQSKVLYLNLEMSLSEIQRRGRKIGFDTENDDLVLLNEDDFNLNQGPGEEDLKFKWLLNFIYKEKIRVLIIDTFRASAGGLKEEKAEEVRKYFQKFLVLKNSGVSIIFLEHVRKPTQLEGKIPKKEQLLGSQDKTANTEILLMIRRDETSGTINMYQRKNRLGPEIPPFAIKLTDCFDGEGRERMTFEYAGELEDDATKKDEAKELIMGILEDGQKTTKEIIAILQKQVGAKNIRAALKELTLEGLVDWAKLKRENLYFLPKGEKEPEKQVEGDMDDLFSDSS